MRHVLTTILLTGSLAACARPVCRAACPDLRAHVADAAAGASSAAPAAGDPLAALDAKIAAIQAEWQERLKRPETLSAFYEPGSEAAALRAFARRPDLAQAVAATLRLDHVLAAVYERNPRLRSARNALAGTVEQYAQVTYLDTIQRQYVSFLRSSMTRLRPTVPMDAVQARFPFPGTLELKAALVKHAVEGARARYEATVRDVLTEARTTYAAYAYLARAVAITRETIGYLNQLEETARSKLSTGTAQKAHVVQTQVEISGLETDLITLGQERETARTLLNTLMDLPAEGALAEPTPEPMAPFPPSAEPAYVLATTSQPDIAMARAKARRIATMIELAEKMAYPSASAGLAYMEDVSQATLGSDKAREPFDTRPKVRPDPWFGTKEAYLREVREQRRAADEAVREALNRTRYRVKDAYVRLATAKRVHELYRDVQIAQAEQAYRDVSAGYAADRVGFLNVVDALRRWLGFLLASDRALRDYRVAHARLEAAMGAPVSRLGD